MAMQTNPYEPPSSKPTGDGEQNRQRALLHLRVALCLLLIAALCNYFYFDREFITASPNSTGIKLRFRIVNLTGIVILAFFVWTAGLPFLEGIARFLRRAFAPHSLTPLWNEQLYRALLRLLICAPIGVGIWIGWVLCVYEFRLPFVATSVAFGIPAHILGACVYVPMLFNWYRIRSEATEQK